MLHALNETLEDMSQAQTKLVLLIGPPGSGKSRLLRDLASSRRLQVVQVGAALARHLAPFPSAQRPAAAVDGMREIAGSFAAGHLVLFDNLELLFDRSLQLDPLGLLKRQARVHRVVAAWPGELCMGRLLYGDASHPEHQDYDLSGFVPFEMNRR